MKWLFLLGFSALAAAGGIASWLLAAGPQAAPGRGAGTTPPEVHGIGYVEPASEVRQLLPRTGGVVRRCQVRAALLRSPARR